MSEAQAEVLADELTPLIDERLATKDDLANLATKFDLADLNSATRANLAEVKADLMKRTLARSAI